MKPADIALAITTLAIFFTVVYHCGKLEGLRDGVNICLEGEDK